eukprot:s347_g21.t1
MLDPTVESLQKQIDGLRLQLLVKDAVHLQVLNACTKLWASSNETTSKLSHTSVSTEVQTEETRLAQGICGVSETGATFTSTFTLGLDETLPEHGESEILCDDEEKGTSSGASRTGQLVCAQVEFYFSDENLHGDKFFSDLIARDSAGWVSLAPIMRCNKIKAFNISEDEVLEAVQASECLEIQNRRIRRRIPFQPRNGQKDQRGEGREGANPKGKGKGGKGKDGKGKDGKGKGNSDQMVRAAPVVDPSGPCGYFMAGYCNHGDSCLTRHSVLYAMAIRHEWLNPGDPNARKDLQSVAAEILGEARARDLFPRVFSHKIQIKLKGKDFGATASNATNISDLGFEWSTGSTGVDAEAPAEKTHRWSRRFQPAADVQTVTPAHQVHQAPKIRYFLVFDLEGKYEIIEFPVLLFDAVTGSEIGRFQKFVRPKDLFKGCPLTDTPAEPFPAVLEEFNSWLHKMVGKGLQEMGTDSSDMVFVTCGDWDCKHVKTQCKIWDAMMNLLRDLHKELDESQSKARVEAPPSAPQSKLPIDPCRLEELVAARLSKWVYCTDGISEPIPELPGVSLSAGCVSEELQTGSVRVALVTAELPGDHKTLFAVFKGTSYLLDVVNWNMEHDYEVIGDGNHFMHKGAAGIMRNLLFMKVKPDSDFARRLDEAYKDGVRNFVLAGHSLGGMYAMAGMYFAFQDLQNLLPDRCRLRGDARKLLRSIRCVTFGSPMCFGADAPSDEFKFASFEAFAKERAVNFINGGDPCPRAWSVSDPRDIVREAAEYLKEQAKERNMVSGRIAAKVIQAATSAFLAREDTNHLVGSSQGFKHVSTIRLLSREDREQMHWKRDFCLSRRGFEDHIMAKYCDLLFDACYATEPTCHVYNDDEYGTKLIVTRVRPSFVQRLLWSNSASEVQAAPESEPKEPQEPQEHEPGPSLQDLLNALDADKLDSEGKPVAEALASYKSKVISQGHFHLGARWLSMEDPIDRELVVNAIHKYQNTWPDSLEAKGRLQMSLREAQLLLLALDAYKTQKERQIDIPRARTWHLRRFSASDVQLSQGFWRRPLHFRPWRRSER